MRHGSSGRRGRNRGGNSGGNRNRGGNVRAQVFDSNGPEVRIRGTAFQIQEKYAVLAKDAAASGDYVLAESYLQHAEHYQRLINSWNEQYGEQPQRQPQQHPHNHGNQLDDAEDDLALPGSIVGAPAQKADATLEDA